MIFYCLIFDDCHEKGDILSLINFVSLKEFLVNMYNSSAHDFPLIRVNDRELTTKVFKVVPLLFDHDIN